MRKTLAVMFVAALGLAAGCNGRSFDGPTVDEFNGRLTRAGQPVSFPAGEEVLLQLFHERGESFGIPVKSDGTFDIGWMPTGKYSAMLIRQRMNSKTGPSRFNIAGGLTIVDGMTQYTIDLGPRWRP